MDSFLNQMIDTSGVLDELEQPRLSASPITSPYTIEVFIEWNNCVATMLYPSQEPDWHKRVDCGSHSQHRWSIYRKDKELVQLVVKHNSCEKALGFQPYCRHCENKASWRQPCLTPQNVFYILRVAGSTEECQASIENLIQSKRFLTDAGTVSSYQRSKQRVAWDHKHVDSNKRVRFDKLEKDVERMVVQQNMARIELELSEFLRPEKEDVEKSLNATNDATNDANELSDLDIYGFDGFDGFFGCCWDGFCF